MAKKSNHATKIIPKNLKVDSTAGLTFANLAKALEFITRNSKAHPKEHDYSLASHSDSDKINVTVTKKTAAIVSAKTNITAPVITGGKEVNVEIIKIDSPNFKGEVAKVTPKDVKAADVIVDAKCGDGQQLVADKNRGIVGCKDKLS